MLKSATRSPKHSGRWRRANWLAQYESYRIIYPLTQPLPFFSLSFSIHPPTYQISRATAAVSSTIATTTEPIRNTAAYKTLAETLVDALDDSGTAKHAGFEEKEARRARRQLRLAKAGKEGRIKARVAANPEFVFFQTPHDLLLSFTLIYPPFRAGEALVLHASSPRQERWQQLKETNPILRKVSALHGAYQESENPVVSTLRSVTSTVASWFDENETARVLRSMKMLDPTFSMESFERELREYIVPEVVDAYLSADNEALKSWCSEAVRPPNRPINHERRRHPLTCFLFRF